MPRLVSYLPSHEYLVGSMAYWWVSQNKTYNDERRGSYMWAPLSDRGGNVPHHWQTMRSLAPGDIVVSYQKMRFPAFGVVASLPYESDAPTDFQRKGDWSKQGIRVEMVYEDLDPSIHLTEVADGIIPLLSKRYSPLNVKGTGNQGYLFSLPDDAGEYLLSAVGANVGRTSDEVVAQTILRTVPDDTERRRLAKSRIGQGQFRDDLLGYWNSKCAVTGLDLLPLLRASHIKPWTAGTNAERVDPFNGLLLSSSYDLAFDSGYISFDNSGCIILSRALKGKHNAAGISPTAKLATLDDRHKPYLSYHRSKILR